MAAFFSLQAQSDLVEQNNAEGYVNNGWIQSPVQFLKIDYGEPLFMFPVLSA